MIGNSQILPGAEIDGHCRPLPVCDAGSLPLALPLLAPSRPLPSHPPHPLPSIPLYLLSLCLCLSLSLSLLSLSLSPQPKTLSWQKFVNSAVKLERSARAHAHSPPHAHSRTQSFIAKLVDAQHKMIQS